MVLQETSLLEKRTQNLSFYVCCIIVGMFITLVSFCLFLRKNEKSVDINTSDFKICSVVQIKEFVYSLKRHTKNGNKGSLLSYDILKHQFHHISYYQVQMLLILKTTIVAKFFNFYPKSKNEFFFSVTLILIF